MTDHYLRSLGFAPTDQEKRADAALFERSWRYQHENQAQDGSCLFLEHPLGVDACRLSALAAPLAVQDVFSAVGLHDRPALEAAVAAFFGAHGGQGGLAPRPARDTSRPQRHAR